MTQKFSFLLAEKLFDVAQTDESDKALWIRYCVEVVLINIFKIIQIYLFAYLLDTVLITVITQFSFSLLRRRAYGRHAKTSIGCTLECICYFVLIPKLLLGTTLPLFLILIVGALGIGLLWLYAPADTDNNPVETETERKKLKRQAIITMCGLLVIQIFCPWSFITLGVFIGTCAELLTIVPIRKS